MMFTTTYAPNTGRSAEIYRIVIAYPEIEIHNIKHIRNVDKTGFLNESSYLF